ncbi:unnamed protein product [Camellia sinensis]
MAEPTGVNRLREVPGEAPHRYWDSPDGGLSRRSHRRLLSGLMASLVLPPRHVPPNPPHFLLDHLCLCRRQQGSRRGFVREGLQGV